MCINDCSSALTHSKMSFPATPFSFASLIFPLIGSFQSAYKHLNIDNSYSLKEEKKKKQKHLDSYIPSNNCLIFCFLSRQNALLSIFVSNSSLTFSWNHTICVFIVIIPPEFLPWLVMACDYIVRCNGKTSDHIWIDLAFNRVDHSLMFKQNYLGFFGYAHSRRKFQCQESNLHQSSDQSNNSDNAGSLTHEASRKRPTILCFP